MSTYSSTPQVQTLWKTTTNRFKVTLSGYALRQIKGYSPGQGYRWMLSVHLLQTPTRAASNSVPAAVLCIIFADQLSGYTCLRESVYISCSFCTTWTLSKFAWESTRTIKFVWLITTALWAIPHPPAEWAHLLALSDMTRPFSFTIHIRLWGCVEYFMFKLVCGLLEDPVSSASPNRRHIILRLSPLTVYTCD